jgi:DNA-binding NtrC family response regulator
MSDSFQVVLLAIDDEPKDLEVILQAFGRNGLEVLTAGDPRQGMELVRARRPHIVLMDLAMPAVSGMQLLESIVEFDPGIDAVVMSAQYSTESAVEAIQKGACDYLDKPLSVELLRQRVNKLIEVVHKRQRAGELARASLSTYQFEGIVGRNPQMLDLYARIQRVAPHYRSVLVSGPTGTGKELVARALHAQNPRVTGAFVVCNCAALVGTLFESELFGYVKGAFTGAHQDKIGLFEYANKGTLFLDEIGEVPLAIQAKLLRVLQDHRVQRVGSPTTRQVEVSVVAATNRNLRAMVDAKEFREDLYYRLGMVEITLPRLSQRLEDLPLLTRYFLERFNREYGKSICGLTRRAQLLVASYPWPGNVRELENVLGHACMMADQEVLDVRDLPEQLRRPAQPADEEVAIPLAEMERRHTRRVLEFAGGNKTQAAAILGIGRTTLYRILGESEESGAGGI